MKKNVFKTVIAVLALGAGACGKIPKSHQGNFVESATGFRLELKSESGRWIRQDGIQQDFQAKAMAPEQLAKGEPGIYLRSVGGDKNSDQLEVFWVKPDKSTLTEQYGFISMKAEVVYSRFGIKSREKVKSIAARHCESGQILVDQVSQTFNGGCPGDSRLLDFRRVEKQ